MHVMCKVFLCKKIINFEMKCFKHFGTISQLHEIWEQRNIFIQLKNEKWFDIN